MMPIGRIIFKPLHRILVSGASVPRILYKILWRVERVFVAFSMFSDTWHDAALQRGGTMARR